MRLVLDNEEGQLRPDTYVDVTFNADVSARLTVSAQSVLYDGSGAHVIESLGEGLFRSVPVETGITADGWTEVTDGLSHGQSIVTSGQFMIDAESNLRSGTGKMGGRHEH